MLARVLAVMGMISVGFSAVSDPHLQPVQPHPAADSAGRARPQSITAGHRPDRSPTDAVHGLCRFFRGLRIRHRCLARWASGCGVGALVAALDHRRLGVPRYRHHAGLVVGLLRTRLGRLVVLGPGRECLVHAVAGGYSVDPLASRHGKARSVQKLDRAAGHRCVFPEPAGHLPRTVWRTDVGSRLRLRPGARGVHPDLPADGGRRFADAVRHPRSGGQKPRRLRPLVAGNPAAGQ
jgi:hypothetical protein